MASWVMPGSSGNKVHFTKESGAGHYSLEVEKVTSNLIIDIKV